MSLETPTSAWNEPPAHAAETPAAIGVDDNGDRLAGSDVVARLGKERRLLRHAATLPLGRHRRIRAMTSDLGAGPIPYYFFPPAARNVRAALSASAALSKARNIWNLLPITPAETPRRLIPASASRRVI